MSKLDDILNAVCLFSRRQGIAFPEDQGIGTVEAEKEVAKQQIKDLFIELIGNDEYEESMKGDDRSVTMYADDIRETMRDKVNEL